MTVKPGRPAPPLPEGRADGREAAALSVEWALIRGPETLQPGTVFLSRESSYCPDWSREVEPDALRLMRQAVRDVTRGPWAFFTDDDDQPPAAPVVAVPEAGERELTGMGELIQPSDDDARRAIGDAIERHLSSHRDPEFMARLQRRIEADRPILDRLRDRPCPATVEAVLGLPSPVTLPCGGIDGHPGRHRYAIEWSDPAPVVGEREEKP